MIEIGGGEIGATLNLTKSELSILAAALRALAGTSTINDYEALNEVDEKFDSLLGKVSDGINRLTT